MLNLKISESKTKFSCLNCLHQINFAYRLFFKLFIINKLLECETTLIYILNSRLKRSTTGVYEALHNSLKYNIVTQKQRLCQKILLKYAD